jgi:hypothetical protein
MRLIATSLAIMTLVAGCSNTGRGIDACGPWRPIIVSRQDHFTELTARQILAHNEAGARLCNWEKGAQK